MIFKYRAWFKQEEKMYSVGEVSWAGGKVSDIELLDTDNIRSYTLCMAEEVVLMPHIGLSDTSGRNVYENDIVELRYKLYPKKLPVICVVWWLDYKACFRAVKSKNFIANIGNTDKYIVKVIGNTFEDPKLWKDTEGVTTYYSLNKKQKEWTDKLANK